MSKNYKPVLATQIPSQRYMICFPAGPGGEPIKSWRPFECGCAWVYAPDITGSKVKPFALKFAFRHCKHYGMVNR